MKNKTEIKGKEELEKSITDKLSANNFQEVVSNEFELVVFT